MRLIIEGTLPGLNQFIAAQNSNRWSGANMKAKTEEKIGWHIKEQLRGVSLDCPVRLEYLWVEANHRRDKDNIAFAKKFVQDALVANGVLKNDGWKQIVGFSDDFAVDKDNPRVEVTIIEITERF